MNIQSNQHILSTYCVLDTVLINSFHPQKYPWAEDIKAQVLLQHTLTHFASKLKS